MHVCAAEHELGAEEVEQTGPGSSDSNDEHTQLPLHIDAQAPQVSTGRGISSTSTPVLSAADRLKNLLDRVKAKELAAAKLSGKED